MILAVTPQKLGIFIAWYNYCTDAEQLQFNFIHPVVSNQLRKYTLIRGTQHYIIFFNSVFRLDKIIIRRFVKKPKNQVKFYFFQDLLNIAKYLLP
jgi:hypothetical protein